LTLKASLLFLALLLAFALCALKSAILYLRQLVGGALACRAEPSNAE
jgi:hypothetical protein